MRLISSLLILMVPIFASANSFWNSGCKNTPWGPVKVGYSNTAYSSSAPVGVACSTVQETRTCAKKVLSGSFTNTSCLSGCAAGTTSNCNYVANASGASSGTCAGGYSGACSFSCTNGARAQVSNTCVSACGGTLVGGYCYYMGATGASCNATCSSHGGVNGATTNYSGHLGSQANCVAVLAAFGYSSGTFYDLSCGGAAYQIGCYYNTYSPGARGRCTDGTSYSATDMWSKPACACNN